MIPAMGLLPAIGRRAVLLRVTVVVCLLAAAVLARNTGVLRAEQVDSVVPPMPAAAQVLPGVLRGAAPSDLELTQMRDSYGVRAVVAVAGASIEERAVVRSLDLELFELDVLDEGPPGPEPMLELVRFVRSATEVPGEVVYVHDAFGRGPDLITAVAMLQVLDGATARAVLAGLRPEERAALDPAHVSALAAVAAVAEGRAASDNPYFVLQEVAR
jgi:hypothetical protein